jgi:hypothetical protein
LLGRSAGGFTSYWIFKKKYKKKHAMHLTKGAAEFSICTTRAKFRGDTNFGSKRITQIYQ